MPELPEHVRRNRVHWDQLAASFVAAGEHGWATNTLDWGIWNAPEAEVGMVPSDILGKDMIELGCGTAYICSWLARRGAHVVGIDNSEKQLETAKRLQREYGLEFPLLHGNAENVPYPDESFDFAISEYGACLWADPRQWIPEASRLLRPGGRLHFLTNSWLLSLCVPDDQESAAGDRLLRPAFGMYRMESPTDESVEFHISHRDWIRLLRSSGFDIEDMVEIRPAPNATAMFPFVTPEWARQWPSEEVWKARKR